MKLYHGSKQDFVALERRQASKDDHLEVPEKELLDAIYLTPDYGFAFACAARPEGVTEIDNESRTIRFENPEAFDPEQAIHIYEVDSEDIPGKDLVRVDDLQYAVINTDRLEAGEKFTHKARELRDFYRLENWEEAVREAGNEAQRDGSGIR